MYIYVYIYTNTHTNIVRTLNKFPARYARQLIVDWAPARTLETVIELNFEIFFPPDMRANLFLVPPTFRARLGESWRCSWISPVSLLYRRLWAAPNWQTPLTSKHSQSMLLVLQRVAVCCCVLQSVAMCCSVLQCVAVCCSVLQCVAVCCSVLQCVAVLHLHWCDQERKLCCS